ncbi:hypothetical protein [Amantichitinum ursilacus]|uniref:Uncharacterized protein n=1 Tax=Amantichitinum ursilacus TaxID=857265 RepID=A0A0N0XN86_9NEIS|nr:hypothetical protein [Amantichitinum ursilacus]KPC55455.1 hypothetical protein WG78_02320 [Amantichitinum ursilacus]
MMWSRVAAGATLGLTLCIALISAVMRLWPAPWPSLLVPAVAFFFPLWVAIMIICARVQRTLPVWGVLLVFNAVIFLALWSTRHALV